MGAQSLWGFFPESWKFYAHFPSAYESAKTDPRGLMICLLHFQSGRLYSTKFMRVLLRAKVRLFSSWGIEMLVGQLYDQSRSVALTALSILDEACEDKVGSTSRQLFSCSA